MSPDFRRKKLIAIAAVPACLAALAAGVLLWQVHRAVHPPRAVEGVGETVSALVRFEEIRFEASDGVPLSGWLFGNRPGAPGVVLCHDFGSGKASLLTMAVPLQKAGFIVLAFDFRGHGDSRGDGTSLGIAEARDVLGAVRFLVEGDEEGGRKPVREVGIYGIGMGAHAAVLAAGEDPRVRALVLDGLYPDAGWKLRREMFGGRGLGQSLLSTPSEMAFNLLRRTRIARFRAADVLPSLTGRDILLIAPAGDYALAEEVRTLFDTIPDQRNADGNLVTLPSAAAGTLFGENLRLYRQRIESFFTDRLHP